MYKFFFPLMVINSKSQTYLNFKYIQNKNQQPLLLYSVSKAEEDN